MGEGAKGTSMDIIKKREGNQLNVTLSGELNTVTASEFDAAVKGDVKPGDTVVIDMANVIYITSAGLRVLLSLDAANGEGSPVILRGVRDEIREVLEVTGFDTVLVIE